MFVCLYFHDSAVGWKVVAFVAMQHWFTAETAAILIVVVLVWIVLGRSENKAAYELKAT